MLTKCIEIVSVQSSGPVKDSQGIASTYSKFSYHQVKDSYSPLDEFVVTLNPDNLTWVKSELVTDYLENLFVEFAHMLSGFAVRILAESC